MSAAKQTGGKAGGSAAGAGVPDDIGYAEALDELEEILGELEGYDLDVDVLAERVRRAGDLIAVCRARILRAGDDVAAIVAELEAANPDDADEVE